MNAVKKTVGDYVSNARSLTGWGDDAAAAGRTVGENLKQEQDYKNATQQPNASNSQAEVPKYHKGGKVRKTGVARLLKGERVLSRAQTKKFDRAKRAKAQKAFSSDYDGHKAIGGY